MENFHSTTIICVKKNNTIAIAGDGQVSLGNTIMKSFAKKVRRVYHNKIVVGFAGKAADGFTLLSKFEEKLHEHSGNLLKSCVELSKDWRTDKILRNLEAMMIVTDGKDMFLLTGIGDMIQPDDAVIAIGSGGSYALSAAKVLMKHSKLNAEEIAKEALLTASEICIYTNNNITVEVIQTKK